MKSKSTWQSWNPLEYRRRCQDPRAWRSRVVSGREAPNGSREIRYGITESKARGVVCPIEDGAEQLIDRSCGREGDNLEGDRTGILQSPGRDVVGDGNSSDGGYSIDVDVVDDVNCDEGFELGEVSA